MSLTTKLILFAAFIMFMLLMSSSYRKRKKRVIFFGDSITEQGALFGGFIQRIAMYMQDEGISDKYELVGMGKGGNKVTDLQNRLSRDVLEKGAEAVVMFIGINDVLHSADGNEQAFKKVYENIIASLNTASIKLILCTPAVAGERITELNYTNKLLDKYCDIIRELAFIYELPLVDLRQAFKNYLMANNIEEADTGLLTKDGIHLNEKGNNLLAEEIFAVLKKEFFTGANSSTS